MATNGTEAFRLAARWAEEAHRNGTGDNYSASYRVGGIVERWMLDQWRKEAAATMKREG